MWAQVSTGMGEPPQVSVLQLPHLLKAPSFPSLSQGLPQEVLYRYLPNTKMFTLWIIIVKIISENEKSFIFIFGYELGCGSAHLISEL